MRQVETRAHGVRDAVINAKAGDVEGKTRQRRCVAHLLAGLNGLGRVSAAVSHGQVLENQLHGLLAPRIGKVAGAGRDIGLDGVGQGVKACVGRDGGRHRKRELGVENRLGGQQVVTRQRVLGALGRVGDNGVVGNLRSGARRRGNCDQRDVAGLCTHAFLRDRADGLGRVDGRAAAQGHDDLGPKVEKSLHALRNDLDRRVGNNAAENLHLAVGKVRGDLLGGARSRHEVIGNEKNMLVGNLCQTVQGTLAIVNVCLYAPALHQITP